MKKEKKAYNPLLDGFKGFGKQLKSQDKRINKKTRKSKKFIY